MKSCSPLPDALGSPWLSCLLGGIGGFLGGIGDDLVVSWETQGGGGGGGGNAEPSTAAARGGGGMKSGGSSRKPGGGGGGNSLSLSSSGGGGGGGGRKSSGGAGKEQLPGPLDLGGKAGLPQVSEDRLSGGGGGRLDFGPWFSLVGAG